MAQAIIRLEEQQHFSRNSVEHMCDPARVLRGVSADLRLVLKGPSLLQPMGRRSVAENVGPRPRRHHRCEQWIVVARAQCLRLHADALRVAEHQRLPQLGVDEDESRWKIAVKSVVKEYHLRSAWGRALPRPHEDVARVRVAMHKTCLEDLRTENLAKQRGDAVRSDARLSEALDVRHAHSVLEGHGEHARRGQLVVHLGHHHAPMQRAAGAAAKKVAAAPSVHRLVLEIKLKRQVDSHLFEHPLQLKVVWKEPSCQLHGNTDGGQIGGEHGSQFCVLHLDSERPS
mmetsp:Transcript_40806/g.95273  ORF Transcript_40806/g.95273 Transcript_40806/m.95273 type:complete len:286 (+) Transcript_40806:413-1270(+)